MISCDLALELFLPSRLPCDLQRHRARLIVARVRALSAVFAVLTPAWILIDAMAFGWPSWGVLAALRVCAAAAFAVLARVGKDNDSLGAAYLMLAAMLAIPAAFFLAFQPMLMTVDDAFLRNVVAKVYSFLPFIVVAVLGVFPLTALETAAAAIPVACVTILSASVSFATPSENLPGIVWFMLLVVGTAAISGMSQLHYTIHLIKLANRDALTGVLARRSGADTLDHHFRLAERERQPLAVGLIDIDDFKSINDRWGHRRGDDVLRSVAHGIGRSLRRTDVLVRWGGEEFVVLLPNTGGTGLHEVTRRLRSADLGTRPDGGRITVSIGLAERLQDAVLDGGDLIDIADTRMYVAKSRGKDTCVGPEAMPLEGCSSDSG